MKRVSRRAHSHIPAVLDRSSRRSSTPQSARQDPPSIHAVAVFAPYASDALRAAPELAPSLDATCLSGLTPAQIDRGTEGAIRYCERIRARPHRVLFLSCVPEHALRILHRLPPSAAPIPFCASLSEWELLAFFGQPCIASPLPPITAFNGLSDAILFGQIADIFEKLNDTRLLDLAVYLKVTDIFARGWL